MHEREPRVKDQSQTDELTQVEKDFITDLRQRVQQFDIDGTETWRSKMQTARNQRQGIKRVSNHPYPGAPDIPLPETDKLIRKHKPNFVLSATSGKSFMSVNPMQGTQEINAPLKDKARKAEIAMNHIFKDRIPWIRRLTLAADRFLEKGHVNFKIIERYDTNMINQVLDLERDFAEGQVEQFKNLSRDEQEQFLFERFGLDPEIDSDKKTIDRVLKEFNSGEMVIEFETEEVQMFPDVLVPMPEKVFVPKGTTDIGKATRVTHEFFLPEHILWQKANKGIYIKDKVMKILKERNNLKSGDKDINEKLRDRLAGVSDSENAGELFRIHETYTWFQPEEGKPFERWVFTFLADIGEAEESLIQKMPYPFSMPEWNWERHDNEVVDDNHYRSRGIPEQIRALQEFLERSVNNMLIRDEINNAPMYTVTADSKIMSNSVRFIPGQKIRVTDHNEIKPLIETRNVDVSSERIMQNLKAFAEEYVGSVDQLFRNATNKGGGKTLGEIKEGIGVTQFLLTLDIANWLDTLRRVYTKVFMILRERLTTPIIVNGEVITREDFQFDPDIRPNGSLEEADKQLQAQKALARLQVVRQGRQDGVATLEDLFNAYQEYLEKDGVTNPDDLTTDPKQILQELITQMEQRAGQLNVLIQQQNQILQQGEQALDRTEQELRNNAQSAGV